ncbi:trifunctional transcriptional regulator/proline dehydrogenase/L-glutamate gamma-semialdehyde dehydrogenase [Gluconobacter oxydans]|uniref:bifunctional proline dehydrogenase/L-glutamate gamma-semialdehyde dehydrogenase PutA n=1 Tax=Gluconobacter thailandicus TaxID=257438 RepID=UPI0002997B95|nr:bifunctional proline dehydrogenase/L-glutamate gamma-semialdehyde dehydrogenase PutA [Gluconobacter thailandicus]AFW00380.1 bifunctional protein putA [Gluconobacter oxydans H24]ANQ40869.1 trifunctional transcriptional regulator/proline dehydrogenase/L-glutamate gamma-semialdehyde dehydrogenase [Gluconobacter oxydans]
MTTSFASLAATVPLRSLLRQAITDHIRVPEAGRVEVLSREAALDEKQAVLARQTVRRLVEALRQSGSSGIVQDLVQEYDLSSQEGVALMCLAEALLRIPDLPTRDALIRDKIGSGQWHEHISRKSSLFVNAATWGLVVSGKVLSTEQTKALPASLKRLIGRCGEPVIRKGVDLAMRMMGEQFVTGQTIENALENSKPLVAKGFRYSYDMLGEAATTMADADRYYRDYELAIHAIGKAAAGAGVYRGPGISVKLSALHPRYSRLQRGRVLAELGPRLTALARLACQYDIGFNIDAEETERLELSLDLLEALCHDDALKDWKGIGFVVQAYQKRAPFVLDWIIDLARRTNHRLMVRLVKGAYWDSEIKRAQVEGMENFPLFTQKVHTDISYIACAKKLLAASDAIFPQFATHNAQTLASIHALADPDFTVESYEFQCLHGMGETLYKEVVGPEKLDRPVRVYAPVGTHETLLAYLVRRLLENGANSSFVNRIQDPAISIEELITDPVTLAASLPAGAIRLPLDMFQPERQNSRGLDLSDENTLKALGLTLSIPTTFGAQTGEAITNPANRQDKVGFIQATSVEDVKDVIRKAQDGFEVWKNTPVSERAACLEKAASHLEDDMPRLIGLIIREAGKTLANAVSEIREAVDFLRYYAAQIRRDFADGTAVPLGPVVCISPWNFPLAIFLGQVSASLAAGNSVLAKPAEETPLIAREAIRCLHESGVPEAVVQLVQGGGDIGAALVADPRVTGVLFTGSTEVAKLIEKQLSQRLNPNGSPVPLIAETGGQNALVVDSSALSEQVVADVLSSAFDSAGQRCSALRVLCLQDDSADRVLTMLKGAMDELRTGDPSLPETDVGPVISAEAQAGILRHIEEMRARGFRIHQSPLEADCENGTFVAPTLIEIDSLSVLQREIFGPVLHVVRYQRDELPQVMKNIHDTGYALTFGVHSRIDKTIEDLKAASEAGNIYINRNLVGAVVGVQPFGGHGLSGTGPKAGGPLYLRRLLAHRPEIKGFSRRDLPVVLNAAGQWLRAIVPDFRAKARVGTLLGAQLTLPGPVGEENVYTLTARGIVLCAGPTLEDVCQQVTDALTAGNVCAIPAEIWRRLPSPPVGLLSHVLPVSSSAQCDIALCNGDEAIRKQVLAALHSDHGPVVCLHTPDEHGHYPMEWLVQERVCSTNTTAAGGNAALMAVV